MAVLLVQKKLVEVLLTYHWYPFQEGQKNLRVPHLQWIVLGWSNLEASPEPAVEGPLLVPAELLMDRADLAWAGKKELGYYRCYCLNPWADFFLRLV